jgi:outer membrane cobalamin receptor
MPPLPIRGPLAALCLLGGAASATHAQGTLPPVEVRASQFEELGPDSTANPYRVAPSSRTSVQTLTADDIAAANPRDVFDLLGHAVGVVPLYQGRKVPVHLQIRGESNFAYIIDGAYVERDTGARILGSLPVSAIERVEIVRDATALTLGPMVNFASPSGAANDGFIVIRTRKPPRTGGQAKALAESNDTYALEAGAAWRGEQGGYLAAAGRTHDTDGPSDAHAARNGDTVLAQAGFADERLSVDLLAYRDHGSIELQRADASGGAVMADQKWAFEPIETTLFALNAALPWNSEQTTLLAVSRNQLTATLRQASFTSSAFSLHDNEETTSGASLRHSWRRGGTLLQAGLQYNHWRTPTGQLFYEFNPRDEEMTSGFLQAEQKLLGDTLVLDGAVRSDRKKIILGVDSYGHFAAYNGSAIRDRTLPAADFLSLGASWRVRPSWLLNARFAHGTQSAGIGVRTEPGVTLGEEIQRKYELAAVYSGWAAYFTPQFTLFHTEVENYKYPTRFDAATQQAVFGQTDARKTGFELQAHGRLGEDTRWHAGWTHMAHNRMVDDHGRTAPRDQAVLDATQAWGRWELRGALQYVSAFASSFPTGQAFRKIGDFTRLDLSAAWHLQLGALPATLVFYGRNVTDKRYRTQVGFEEPGATWGFSAQVTF